MPSWYNGSSPINESVPWPRRGYNASRYRIVGSCCLTNPRWPLQVGGAGGFTTPVATTNYDNLSVIYLGNPKLTGGSINEIVEAKTTLTLICEIALTFRAPLG